MKLADIQDVIPKPLEVSLNWTSIGATVATIAGYLPAVAALFSIVWLSLQIWLFFKNKPWKRRKE